MDDTIRAAIAAIWPCGTELERWRQYGKITQELFPLVPTEDMDELCRAVAERLGL